ncbi:MAG: M28 family peptidase [Saprospiraceae bacterium]|nr:M28 family peptidase [Saprospiraceae bacterium]
MQSNKILSVFFFFGLLLFLGCKSENSTPPSQSNSAKTAPPTNEPQRVSFNRDSAYIYVAKQVDFGPRVIGSEGHKACKEWLVQQFEQFGATVIEQDFDAKVYTGKTYQATNVIAQYNPATTNRILLAAHWDTRHIADSPISTDRKDEPILGADDGGSGVGVLLELGRQLKTMDLQLGVDIVLFDAEDYGESKDDIKDEAEGAQNRNTWALGSQHWANNLHRSGYKPRYGILLDMVGARNARFPKEQYSTYFAAPVVDKVWNLANKLGYSNYFHNAEGGGVTDDHYFVNTIAEIPMIDIINLPIESENKGFGNHWHTQNDNMDVINKRTLKAVGQVLLELLIKEDAGQL